MQHRTKALIALQLVILPLTGCATIRKGPQQKFFFQNRSMGAMRNESPSRESCEREEPADSHARPKGAEPVPGAGYRATAHLHL